MDVEYATSNLTAMRSALLALQALNLTDYRYPVPEMPAAGCRDYDFIVCGAGSAGAVIANRLTEDPHTSVLLIEAGGNPPFETVIPATIIYPLGSEGDWKYSTPANAKLYRCMRNNTMNLFRGKMLGGTSSINFLLYIRGDPHDYDLWAEITKDPEWSYKNVLPYFKKSERLNDSLVSKSPNGKFHNTNGYLGVTVARHKGAKNFLNSYEELGYKVVLDTNGNFTLGFSEPMVTLDNGVRQSTANSFLTPIINRPNLHVMTDTLVTKIIIKNKVARGVEVLDKQNRKYMFTANKEVIVSAGAINTPHILMLSGIGPREHLNSLNIKVIADLPVGKNLQNHIASFLTFALGPEKPSSVPLNPNVYPFPIINGFVSMNSSQSFPDYQINSLILDSTTYIQLCTTFSLNDDICQQHYEESKGRVVYLVGCMIAHPNSRGKILLRSKNPKDNPIVYDAVLTDKSDIENAVKYIKDLYRLVNTTYFKSVNGKILALPQCDTFDYGSDDYWRCHVQCYQSSYFHFGGSCAMGAVVDSRLRVLGISRLRVADASVMPVVSSGNTNAPTIMIGEKAADMIKQDNGLHNDIHA